MSNKNEYISINIIKINYNVYIIKADCVFILATNLNEAKCKFMKKHFCPIYDTYELVYLVDCINQRNYQRCYESTFLMVVGAYPGDI